MSKIKEFLKLLDEGVSREEARDKSGVADGTSKVQMARWKKGKGEEVAKPTLEPVKEEVKTDEDEEEDIEITPAE